MSEALKALLEAIEVAGGQRALAGKIGVTQPAVSNWVNRTGRAPAEQVLKIEEHTGVSRHKLRADIYPRETPSMVRKRLRCR